MKASNFLSLVLLAKELVETAQYKTLVHSSCSWVQWGPKNSSMHATPSSPSHVRQFYEQIFCS